MSFLAEAQAEVLEAMGIGVVACDSSFRMVAASRPARALLARLAPRGATAVLPDAIAGLLRTETRWPVKVAIGHQTISVWARQVDLPWASVVVWLAVEPGPGEFDVALRRRWHLTRRQIDLVHELRQGYRNQEIAAHLGLTQSTVKSYLSHLFDALGVRSRGEAMALIERTRRGE